MKLSPLHLSVVFEHQVGAHAQRVLGQVRASGAEVALAPVHLACVRRHLVHLEEGLLADAAHIGHSLASQVVINYQRTANFDGFVWIIPANEEIQINPLRKQLNRF